MSKNAILIGGAGTGKTTRLLEAVEKMLARGIDPYELGFISFTKAATKHALSRAARQFQFDESRMERDGWFRTLHSFCYRLLNVRSGEILVEDSAEGKKWFCDHMGFSPGSSLGSLDKSPQELTLDLWNVSRQRLEPWSVTHARVGATVPLPTLEHSRGIIADYTSNKRLNNRIDFTDLLGRFAGVRFTTDDAGHTSCPPEGWLPALEAIIVDEAQDNSALMDACLLRLADDSRFAVLAGDPWQSIYGFNGSDSSLFQAWPHDKYEVMPKSHRCAERILALGEASLTHCPDYWDRGISPREAGGEIDRSYSCDEAVSRLAASKKNWLLLTRTNWQLKKFTGALKNFGIPYSRTGDGGTPWSAPSRNKALYALLMLQQGKAIGQSEWAAVLRLKELPVKFGDQQFLVPGTKADWKRRVFDDQLSDLTRLDGWGATKNLQHRIADGTWKSFFPFAREYCRAIGQFGIDVVSRPRVTVSTIHGAKGLEADGVILLDTTSGIVARAAEEPRQRAEEHRLAYVGVTRARNRLTIVTEPHERFRMEIG